MNAESKFEGRPSEVAVYDEAQDMDPNVVQKFVADLAEHLKRKAVERIAMIAHAVNSTYCRAIGEAQPPAWDPESDVAKGYIRGVENVLATPGITPEHAHQLWMAERSASGWAYGPEKDYANKRHPCLRPFHELPAEQRVKDHLFVGTVQALLELAQPPRLMPMPAEAQPPVESGQIAAAGDEAENVPAAEPESHTMPIEGHPARGLVPDAANAPVPTQTCTSPLWNDRQQTEQCWTWSFTIEPSRSGTSGPRPA